MYKDRYFSAFLLLFGICASSMLSASDMPLQDENGLLIEDLQEATTTLSNFKAARIDWEISKGMDALYPRLVARGGDHLCVTLGTTIQDSISLLYDVSSTGTLTRAKGRKNIECSGNSGSGIGGGKAPTFNLFTFIEPSVLTALRIDQDADVRVVIDTDVGSSKVQDFSWKLQARTGRRWTTIGGLNIPDYSSSAWVRDPLFENEVALLLVAEVTTSTSALPAGQSSSEPQTKHRNTPVDTRLFSIKEHANPRAYIGQRVAAPVIKWRDGQNANSLRFEVASAASEPARGRYCVMPVYYPSNDTGYVFNRDPNSERYITGDPVGRNVRDCNNPQILSFLVSVELDASSSNIDTVRFIVDQKDSNPDEFDLQHAAVWLKPGDGRSVLSEYENSSTGKWYRGDDGAAQLFVQSPHSAAESEPLALKFYSDPGNTLHVNGATVAADEVYVFRDSLEIFWDNSQASITEIKLCEKSSCREVLDSFTPKENPAYFQRDQFIGLDEAVFEVVWGEPGDVQLQTTELTASANQNDTAIQRENVEPTASAGNNAYSDQLRLKTNIQFGSYTKPLTTCVGRIATASDKNATGETFALQQGDQIVTATSWPSDIQDDTPLQILFDRKRNGGACSVNGLVLDGVSRSSLMGRAIGGEVSLSLEAPAPLFVGYLQLNSQEYKKSRARWLDSLSFFNRFYEAGWVENDWIDALLLGAGDARGEPRSIIDLSGNFSERLGSDAQREAVVEAQVNRNDVLTDSFSQSLSGMRAIVGDAEIAILYFDDSMESFSCDDYSEDIAGSGLNIKKAVVITSRNNYTGDDSQKSLANGLAHICAQESNKLLVYAFDSSEQHKERQWDETFSAIYENLVGIENL